VDASFLIVTSNIRCKSNFNLSQMISQRCPKRISFHLTESGDVPIGDAYQVIKANLNQKPLNIEVEFDPGADGREEARRR